MVDTCGWSTTYRNDPTEVFQLLAMVERTMGIQD